MFNKFEDKKGFWKGIGISIMCFVVFDIFMVILCFIRPIANLGVGGWIPLLNVFVFPILVIIFGIVARKKNTRIVFNWIIFLAIVFLIFLSFCVSKDAYVRNITIKKYAQAYVLVNYPEYNVKKFEVRYDWYSNSYTVNYTDGESNRELTYNHNKQLINDSNK